MSMLLVVLRRVLVGGRKEKGKKFGGSQDIHDPTGQN
jgi:hypothetical protein